MTQKLDGHLFRTLNGKKKSTLKQRSYYSERHTLYLALSSLQTCPSLITKVGEQLADYFPCGGFVVTDEIRGKKVFRQSGVSGAQTRDFRHGMFVEGSEISTVETRYNEILGTEKLCLSYQIFGYTVETRYNKILGTGTFCLLYQIFCYISSQ